MTILNFSPLVQNISRQMELTQAELGGLHALPLGLRLLPHKANILLANDRPTKCCMIIKGYAYRGKDVASGRQIMSFHMAGDLPDLQSLHLETMDHDLMTIGETLVGFIPHLDILSLIAKHSRLGAYFWRETLIDAAIFREWIINVGGRSGYARISHLLCEQMARMMAKGLAKEFGAPLFLSQTNIAQATGLSPVHVNRIMGAMRNANLVNTKDGRLTILDWRGLVAAGDFDPAYLRLN